MSSTVAELTRRVFKRMVRKPLAKVGGDAIFPSLQTSVSPANTQKTGPILEANVSSERIRPQTRDFPDPHVTGSWSRRTLGQERGLLSTPAVPGPGASVNSQMIEDKITQASWDGKYAALQLFGIPKHAGFFQNVVGFDDPEQVKSLREVGDSLAKVPSPWFVEGKPSPEYAEYRARREAAKKAFKGTPYGWLGKYMEVPEMNPYSDKAIMSGSPTGAGYMSKKDLLKYLESMKEFPTRTPDVLGQLSKSPHEYFTSTEFE